MNTTTCNIQDYSSDWDDPKLLQNIRTIGTYPRPYYHKHPKGLRDIRTFDLHKPFGMATERLDPYDDRPDWFKFKAKPKKRYYEEITPTDPEFHHAIEQDQKMHDKPNPHHTHIKLIEPDTTTEEIGDTIII